MTANAAAGIAPEKLPRAFQILTAVALLALANRYAPGTVQGVLLLVILYALLTNVPRALELIQTPESALATRFARHTGPR